MITPKNLFSFTHSKICWVCLLVIMLIFSCKEKTADEKLMAGLHSNLTYKSYKTLSENSIPPLVMLYNSATHKDEPKVSEGLLRLLLGFSWAVDSNPDFAIAESEIVQDLSPENKNVSMLAHLLSSIAMVEKGWPSLAQQESKKGFPLLNEEPKSQETSIEILTFRLITGTTCLYKENYQRARFHFAGYGLVTGIKWPYQIVDGMTDIKEGRQKEGIKKIAKVSINKEIPDTVRTSLKAALDKSKASTDTISPKLFWTKEISFAMYNDIKNAEITGIEKVTELLSNLRTKLIIK